MQQSILLVLCSCLPTAATAVSADAKATVELQLATGTVKGEITTLNVQRYLGVPFGEPPVGDLRWQPPVPASNWSGVRDALKYSKSCAQGENAFDDFSGISEDCLYLNVWMPNKDPPPADEGYAAMVFFYGGSWTTGSAMFPLYAGEALTVANDATVVITVNYRLAAFGFLASDWLRGNDNSTGNFGLQDQRLAMQWVHENAKNLNVDPSKIMIFGESAGAGSVSSHLVSHRSRGLFTRAAMESGPFADWTSDTLADSHDRFLMFANASDCPVPPTDTPTPAEIATVQSCLRKRNMTEVLEASRHLPGKSLVDWSPTVDGVEFTDNVQILASKGDIANVPVLLGTNRNEGSGFVHLSYTANESELDAYIAHEFSTANASMPAAEVVSKLEAAYPVYDFEAHAFATAAWWAGSEMVGDSEMTCAARRSARFLETLRGPSAESVYVYFFDYLLDAIPAIEIAAQRPFGVLHGSELVLVFGQNELLLTDKERQLSKQVRTYWTNFAYSGDPNVPRNTTEALEVDGLIHWPAHVQATNLTLELDIPLETVANLKRARCDLWDAIGPFNPPP